MRAEMIVSLRRYLYRRPVLLRRLGDAVGVAVCCICLGGPMALYFAFVMRP